MLRNNVKNFYLLLAILVLATGCHRRSEPSGPLRHYTVTGKVLAIDAHQQSATIDAAAIPNFMEAMTMEYPIKNKADFTALHVGEHISGTLDVAADDVYTLTNIKPLGASGK